MTQDDHRQLRRKEWFLIGASRAMSTGGGVDMGPASGADHSPHLSAIVTMLDEAIRTEPDAADRNALRQAQKLIRGVIGG